MNAIVAMSIRSSVLAAGVDGMVGMPMAPDRAGISCTRYYSELIKKLMFIMEAVTSDARQLERE
ncbi:hypothetical protein [Pseudomonas sp. N8]|uniref:hypothetical protein n=1 Tax=Pseudomonas sp. N8 TaxID=3449428 RepID=UPI003F69B684